ncbi:hypothetical protein HNQ77_001520 [Silvibacterium bohemicum]|uniref:Uncharacterized protein n=1 Tax=Silvibacterium bohemicum TaxID=1577686 RepID=A0A841JX59_9BACT|nr:hypothetical protein [Silvibacterium bohemicum]MBB6143571.1 hypothetical protein [Silvibacterium bohemicum]
MIFILLRGPLHRTLHRLGNNGKSERPIGDAWKLSHEGVHPIAPWVESAIEAGTMLSIQAAVYR